MNGHPLRIGIINLMPRAERYEPFLLGPLLRSRFAVEPVWLRLATHRYTSSDPQHIDRRYTTIDCAVRRAPLDGLIISGAPVEELRFDQVVYWSELRELLQYARVAITSTLGLCWGGLALGALLGLPKQRLPDKLFGVFENQNLVADGPFMGDHRSAFPCAHSRHSGIADDVLEGAEDDGTVRLLAHGIDTGYSIFETRDHRFLAHLGHPEYDAARLASEWTRDRALRRPDVHAPVDVDLAAPQTTWRTHCAQLFGGWLEFIAGDSSALAHTTPPPIAYRSGSARSPFGIVARR